MNTPFSDPTGGGWGKGWTMLQNLDLWADIHSCLSFLLVDMPVGFTCATNGDCLLTGASEKRLHRQVVFRGTTDGFRDWFNYRFCRSRMFDGSKSITHKVVEDVVLGKNCALQTSRKQSYTVWNTIRFICLFGLIMELHDHHHRKAMLTSHCWSYQYLQCLIMLNPSLLSSHVPLIIQLAYRIQWP